MDLLRERDKVIEESPNSDDRNPRVILSGVFKGKVFVSYGLRICCVSTQRWLMVKRSHSIEYCIFIRGG
jgi:hypothetical protein